MDVTQGGLGRSSGRERSKPGLYAKEKCPGRPVKSSEGGEVSEA